jgi:metallo-beta-lactamase class B
MSIAVLIISINASGSENKIVISDNLELYKISENCYIHTSYADLPGYPHFPSNGLVYVDGGKALLVDTAWGDTLTQQLLHYLGKNMNLTVESIIVTHWHSDRMAGLESVHNARIKSIASLQTLEICTEKDLPIPQYGFVDSLNVKLNDKTIQAFYGGAAHTTDNIVVFIPDGNILFGGCAIKSLSAAGMGNIADADLQQWPVTLKAIMAKFPQSKIVVPGHGASGDLGLIDHTLDLLLQAEKK